MELNKFLGRSVFANFLNSILINHRDAAEFMSELLTPADLPLHLYISLLKIQLAEIDFKARSRENAASTGAR